VYNPRVSIVYNIGEIKYKLERSHVIMTISTKTAVLGGSALFLTGMAAGAGIMYACTDSPEQAAEKAAKKALKEGKKSKASDVVDAMVEG